jgi:hypothetical protein
MVVVNVGHLTQVLAEYETHVNDHRPHRSLGQATPLRALPGRHRLISTSSDLIDSAE